MSDLAAGIVPWLHPALGLAAVWQLVRAARRGLDVRRRVQPTRGLPHPVLARRAWWFVAGNWVLGLLTVRFFRPELDLAASTHFQAGTAVLVLLTLAGLVSRRIDADPRLRRLHPAIGAAALLLAAVQVFLGLQLTRW
ncbi:MAG TPA: DUF4079 family protein [Candidatus Limnocylindria bacterium]|nr:DUF4079 family protein [Candidatus Limnocylindria bacterium]